MRKAVFFRTFVVCVAFFIGAFVARGGNTEVHETNFRTKSEKALGHENRRLVRDAHSLIIKRQYDEALKKLDKAIANFETGIMKKAEDGIVYHCFQTKEEFMACKKETKGKLIWLDECYGRAYHFKAFISVNKRDLKSAYEYLQKELEIAPYESLAYGELGFISNRLKKSEEALSLYKKSLELANRFQSQEHAKAGALRGMGFSLIELRQLGEAEKCYSDSLKIEPGNKLAKSELKFIRDVRKKQAEDAEKKKTK